tara:strand:+ start:6220 stop:6795 length:576 start_codon:yes stop_codon:yes gene_type:complete
MRLGKKSSSNSNSKGGGFRTVGTVKSTNIKYEHKESWQKYPSDIYLEVLYNDGQDFDKTLKIYGNFNRKDESWGSAFKIERFFNVCGINTEHVNDDWTIPDSWLDKSIGKEFSVISYPSTNLKDNGKPYWNQWDVVMHPDKGSDAHKADFMKSVNAGYVKSYSSDDPLSDMDSNTVTNTTKPELNTVGLEL